MPLAKSKNSVGLGNSLMNDRFGKGKGSDMRRGNAIQRTSATGDKYLTNEKNDASWVKMRSITEQGALDEFLSTAELAGTDFTAEKLSNVKILHFDQKNPYLLSAAEERATIKKQNANCKRLTIPRRPKWDESTTPRELDQRERESLLDWRRGLAQFQESDDLLLTPFERNIEVWRQLWRVIERSDLVVQIVDARNPLLFRSADLERYVKEVDSRKNNLLLVNKADMMTLEQRNLWADYFHNAGINFRFFSAELAKETNEARAAQKDRIDEENVSETEDQVLDVDSDIQTSRQPTDTDPTRILTTDELETLFLENSPNIEPGCEGKTRKAQIGLVGYPNVGKSSTINALIGAKKVSVSATPGKTKHFQTIHLSDQVILCDCPGLVFPNFATTKAELVCNGILPIDQLREFTGPAGLVAQRIPRRFLEAAYGLKINVRPLEEGGTGVPTAREVLRAYAAARGFATQGQGQPDESRAARYVLKDYVKGKLLYCHPPPSDPPIDPHHFNRELYVDARLPTKKRGDMQPEPSSSLKLTNETDSLAMDVDLVSLAEAPAQGEKSVRLDQTFFARGQGNAAHLRMPFHHQYTEQGKANQKQASGRKERAMIALEMNVDPSDVRLNRKKHFKGNKRRGKQKNTATGFTD